jgi:[ribosomal protein S5]-alanine N-acetyltransferase
MMTEAIKRAIEYGFSDLKLHSIEAIVHPENRGSSKLLENNQFIKEAYLKDNQFFDGKFIDSVIYSRINPN